MGTKRIFISIRNFLFSNVNKQFLVFMFFLFLSFIFWLIITLNETYEKEIKIPAQVVGIPKNVVLTSVPVDTVRTTIRDKGWVMMVYLYTDRLGTIQIPFRSYDHGRGNGSVGTNDLKRMIEQRLELSSKVTAIKPDHLEFSYNNGECRRVPVRWAGRVIPDQLYFISHVEYLPDSVEIYASPEKLDSIRAVYTEALNYVNFRDTLNVDCQLAHINDVKVVPDRVHIRFHTDVLTEETISNIPIQCINLPPGKVLRTFPRYAKVHFVAGVSQIRSLHPDDFKVVVDFREIMVSHKEKCSLSLREVPHGVSRAVLDTKEVDYLIEDE
jgi:hypothetical protein